MTMRVRLFTWNTNEAAALIESLKLAGHTIEYEEKWGASITRSLRESPPDAVVIDLTRLPSHGREVAIYLRGNKATRAVSIVFLDGGSEKVEAIRTVMPDAVFTSRESLAADLSAAVKNPVVNPVIPAQMMDRYAGRPAAQKLGIKTGMKVRVIDPPRDYQGVLGSLPENAMLVEDANQPAPVTLWFVEDPDSFRSRLREMARQAGGTKLWILWRKGRRRSEQAVNEQFLRECALAAGLVDYKVCSVNDTWSGLAFACRRAAKAD
jgi:hypothetical protein